MSRLNQMSFTQLVSSANYSIDYLPAALYAFTPATPQTWGNLQNTGDFHVQSPRSTPDSRFLPR